MSAVLTHLAAFYAGAAMVTWLTVGGDWLNRAVSAAFWPALAVKVLL